MQCGQKLLWLHYVHIIVCQLLDSVAIGIITQWNFTRSNLCLHATSTFTVYLCVLAYCVNNLMKDDFIPLWKQWVQVASPKAVMKNKLTSMQRVWLTCPWRTSHCTFWQTTWWGNVTFFSGLCLQIHHACHIAPRSYVLDRFWQQRHTRTHSNARIHSCVCTQTHIGSERGSRLLSKSKAHDSVRSRQHKWITTKQRKNYMPQRVQCSEKLSCKTMQSTEALPFMVL